MLLSLQDDRIKPKGSRDPLGFELVWSHFGRKVVGNLTTITSSLENFSVAMLGFYLTHRLLPNSTEQKHIMECFLRYEQVTAYLRYAAEHRGIMGITRVTKRMRGDDALTLGLGKQSQILSDQASYGLWGLYSSAMRSTGLVGGDRRVPTKEGVELGELIANELGEENVQRLMSWMEKDQSVDRATLNDDMAQAYVTAINNPKVRSQLLEQLGTAGKTTGTQANLWRYSQGVLTASIDREAGMELPEFVAALVETCSNDEVLRALLTDIQNVERLLVTANMLFRFLRTQDGKSIDKVTEALQESIENLVQPRLEQPVADMSVPYRESLEQFRTALIESDIRSALHVLIKQNEEVMQNRGGASWVELEGNIIRVRVSSESGDLRGQQYLQEHWDYDYFLGSFKNIAIDQVRLNA